MTSDAALTAEHEGTVRLRASYPTRIDISRTLDALRTLDWLGTEVEAPAGGTDRRRIVTDLELPIVDGSATGPIRKSALVDIGEPRRAGDAVLVEIGWQSASFAPLFPVFAGQLHITASGLDLRGWYVPPLGRLGLLVDAGVLHLIARRTAQAFLARLAARSEA